MELRRPPNLVLKTGSYLSVDPKAEAMAGQEKMARLEAKLQQKNEVIAELMEENVRAKKANGEL